MPKDVTNTSTVTQRAARMNAPVASPVAVHPPGNLTSTVVISNISLGTMKFRINNCIFLVLHSSNFFVHAWHCMLSINIDSLTTRRQQRL